MQKKLEFLKSPRFWVLVIGSLAMYLQVKGIIGEPERNLIMTIAGGFIGIRTIDRASEQSKAVLPSKKK